MALVCHNHRNARQNEDPINLDFSDCMYNIIMIQIFNSLHVFLSLLLALLFVSSGSISERSTMMVSVILPDFLIIVIIYQDFITVLTSLH